MKRENDLPPIGQHIRRFRKENRWSLSAFAAHMGITKAHLWEVENGRQANPTLRTVVAISRATRTSVTRVINLFMEQQEDRNG
jgi:transcriptional regulator with XRE-family HTH domain